MKYFFGKDVPTTEYKSTEYVYLNNSGYVDNISRSHVFRENGRVDYQLIYVKNGKVRFVTPKGECFLEKGDIWLYRPNVKQEYAACVENTTFYWIHFTGSEIENMLSFFQKDYYHVSHLPEFEEFCKSFYHDLQIRDRYNKLLYEGMLITLFAKIEQRIFETEKPEQNYLKIKKVITFINENYTQTHDNEEYAAMCHLSKYYFIRLFKEITGFTPQQYRTNLIIYNSKQLLKNTQENIGEIARMMGIEDSLYFSRLFKKHVGVSPDTYRKTHN